VSYAAPRPTSAAHTRQLPPPRATSALCSDSRPLPTPRATSHATTRLRWLAPLGIAAALSGCADGKRRAEPPRTTVTTPPAAGDAGQPADADLDEIRDLIGKQVAPPPGHEPQVPGPVGDPGAPSPADPRIGTLTTIVGTAANAALGAVVVDEQGDVYYLDGLAEWDDALLDRRVEVTGTLRRKKLAPDPVVGPGGEVSHGMKGTALVLDNPTWRDGDRI
jgi:hypothetical protein